MCSRTKCELLKTSKTIAVVGISRNPNRISREIAHYLSKHGYNVVGVNPNDAFDDANGIKVYNNLNEIPHHIDIVNVFRRSEDIPSLVDDVVKISPKVLWLQLGIRNDSAVKKIKENGISVIQDSCIKLDHNFCMSFDK